jgi:hypothetical protein
MPNATSNADAIIKGHAARCRNAIERGRVAGARAVMMTVTELLSRAKSAIESGETALHAADRNT